MSSVIISVVVAAVITFGLTSFTEVKTRGRKVRKLIEHIKAFSTKVNQGEIVLYSDDSSNTNLVDEDGISMPVLREKFEAAGRRCQVLLSGLAAGSNVPSKSYRVAVDNYEIQHADVYGHSKNTVGLCFRPANCREDWKVTAVQGNLITCYHRIMGNLTVKNYTDNHYSPNQKIALRQYAYEVVSGRYRINYEIV